MIFDLKQIAQHLRRHWYQDGLTEIAVGVIHLLVGLLIFLEAVGVVSGPVAAVSLPVVIIGGGWTARNAVLAAKEKITYPRTGYAAYRQPSWSVRLASVIVAGVAAVGAALLIGSWPGSVGKLPLLQGLVEALAFIYLCQKLALNRFHGLGAASALLGAGASLLGISGILGSSVYFAAFGVVLSITGGISLYRFLQTFPPSEEA